jgi:hypothetical protein
MIDIREQVVALLKNAAAGVTDEIVYFYPPQQVKKPVITYYEAEHNTNATFLDGSEYLEEIIYQVDVWSESVVLNDELAGKISDAFVGCGFTRQSCYDVHDENCMHKSMRFRGRVSPELVVYR